MKAEAYEVVVAPSRGWFTLDWREFWEYRDLLVLLIQRDVTSRYKQTLLGPLWFVVQPVLTALVFAIIFGRVAGIPTDGIPGPLFYLCGLLGWTYFSQNISNAGASFVNNAHLFGKVYFPRLIVPVSSVISNLFALGLQFAVFFVFAAWYGLRGDAVYFGPAILLALPLLLITATLSLGLSLLFSSSTAKYRDLSHLTPILVQLWMFATPVIYPLSKLTGGDGRFAWIAWMNPMAPVVEGFRFSLLGRGTWNGAMLGVSALASVIILLLGIVAFGRAERTVTDCA